jgi:hypothetical protein
MADFIPNSDADFNAWQLNFVTYANANLLNLGLTLADLAAITSAQITWNTAFPAHVAAQATAQGARANKDTVRHPYEAAIRPLVRRMQGSSAVSDQEKEAMGITVPDPSRTPVAPPTTSPITTIGCGERLRHTLDFRDSTNPNKRSKPDGMIGVEIYNKLTAQGAPAPIDPAEFVFLALDTATPYVSDYPGTDGGKNAHYILRWVNTRGVKGPWSEVFSATIGA